MVRGSEESRNDDVREVDLLQMGNSEGLLETKVGRPGRGSKVRPGL